MTDTAILVDSSRWLRFQRVMFWLLVPGLALPVVAALVMAPLLEARGRDDIYSFGAVAATALVLFMWILLGSTTLRAWQLLRHPDSVSDRRLPLNISIVHGAIDALVIVWTLALVLGMRGEFGLLFGLVLATLSCVDQVFVATRRKGGSVTLAAGRPVGLIQARWLFSGATAIALAMLIVGIALPEQRISNAALVALVVLGLPWSHVAVTLAMIGTLPLVVGYETVPFMYVAAHALIATPAIVTAVFLWQISRSDDAYMQAATWFFRVSKKPANAEEPATSTVTGPFYKR